jgi:hypothetical protein
MAATAQEKAYNLKDSYVADLVDKGKKDAPVMPETNHGDVAIDPVTLGIGAAAVGAATSIWHLPELEQGAKAVVGALYNTSFDKDRGEAENFKQNRGPALLNLFTGLGGYDPSNYDQDHFDKTGKIRPDSNRKYIY